jgi:hypothetical protein
VVLRRERKVYPRLLGEVAWRVTAVTPLLRVCGDDATHSQRQTVRVGGKMGYDPYDLLRK